MEMSLALARLRNRKAIWLVSCFRTAWCGRLGRYSYLFGERVLGEENDMPRTTRLIMEELGAVLGRKVLSFGEDMEKADFG